MALNAWAFCTPSHCRRAGGACHWSLSGVAVNGMLFEQLRTAHARKPEFREQAASTCICRSRRGPRHDGDDLIYDVKNATASWMPAISCADDITSRNYTTWLAKG